MSAAAPRLTTQHLVDNFGKTADDWAVLAGWRSEADRIHVRALMASGDYEGLRGRGYGPIQRRVLIEDWTRGITNQISPPVNVPAKIDRNAPRGREERPGSWEAA